MDDISSKIIQILSDPQSMQQLQNLAQSLGLSAPSEAAPPPPPPSGGMDMNQLGNLLAQFGMGPQTAPAAPSIDMNSILQIQKAMQLFTQSNKNVELLRSLRPLLSEKRQKKVDDAVRIMQLVQMLPMLKESGLFGALGGDRR